MVKRNRVMSLLAAPFAVTIWFVGWIFISVNSKKQVVKAEPNQIHNII